MAGQVSGMTHKELIKGLKCLICDAYPLNDAHHVRNSYNGGMGQTPSDLYILPLCRKCHSYLHQKGERRFWENYGINPYEEIIRIILENESVPF